MHRVYPHIAEHLVVDVPVQLFHQFRTAQSGVHLQEHQRHLPLRREVCSASSLRSHALPGQTEILLRYLMQGELPPDPSKFTLLECLSIQIIKSNSVNGRSGDISEKFCTLAMQIYFCDTSKNSFSKAAGGVLFTSN